MRASSAPERPHILAWLRMRRLSSPLVALRRTITTASPTLLVIGVACALLFAMSERGWIGIYFPVDLDATRAYTMSVAEEGPAGELKFHLCDTCRVWQLIGFAVALPIPFDYHELAKYESFAIPAPDVRPGDSILIIQRNNDTYYIGALPVKKPLVSRQA